MTLLARIGLAPGLVLTPVGSVFPRYPALILGCRLVSFIERASIVCRMIWRLGAFLQSR